MGSPYIIVWMLTEFSPEQRWDARTFGKQAAEDEAHRLNQKEPGLFFAKLESEACEDATELK